MKQISSYVTHQHRHNSVVSVWSEETRAFGSDPKWRKCLELKAQLVAERSRIVSKFERLERSNRPCGTMTKLKLRTVCIDILVFVSSVTQAQYASIFTVDCSSQ